MKKFMIITVAAAMAASCSSEHLCEPEDNNPLEIKLKANVFEVQVTKAPVNNGTSVTASFVASAATGNYATNLWNATATFTASSSTPAAISFTPPQYYSTNGATNVYITGYYPAGSISGNTVTYSTADGNQDLMKSNEVTGNKSSGALAFTFHHLLTQLQFQLVAGSGFPANVNVTSIVVRSQKTPATLNISTGNVTYNTAADLTFSGTFPITGSGGTLATTFPMVKAGEATTISITTDDGVTYPDIALTGLTTLAENSHLITLTFTPKGITATAIITAWVVGTGSSSTVQ